MYFLGELVGWKGQQSLWRFVERGALCIHIPAEADAQRMKTLMEKYQDTPMDLADASLVAAAERLNLQRVFTLDGDFRIYMIDDSTPFEVVP